ncbi:hypothetical protein AMATHDRAFT_52777 [Amanita thiersii Skay4041]|uniref:RNase III domain-containing protein n=1 Tax=Amanita thiersii Skay4041 TaxID=703135 RepID=A0A2A9NV07_9AGAR|nr:hypothetical protein AMATHDRAFT_52777 [Amanita thiersii Skay4041]
MSIVQVFPSQKRARPAANNEYRKLPPLPKITGDVILQVFTHRSLQRSHGGTLEDNSDNERLAVLGRIVLDAVVTRVLFTHRPPLTTSEINTRKKDVLSNENFEEWVNFYGLRTKLRCHPQVFPSLTTSGETRTMFLAYVGGVYAESGIETVEGWIGDLIGIESDSSVNISGPFKTGLQSNTPPAKKIKSEPSSSPNQTIPLFCASQPPPSPERQLPPHMEGSLKLSHTPNPLAPAQPNLPFLPLFNQTANQRRCMVTYPADFSGPPHAGKWTVQCVVNGIVKGVGTGTSKQLAKEEAARRAYYAMGWT